MQISVISTACIHRPCVRSPPGGDQLRVKRRTSTRGGTPCLCSLSSKLSFSISSLVQPRFETFFFFQTPQILICSLLILSLEFNSNSLFQRGHKLASTFRTVTTPNLSPLQGRDVRWCMFFLTRHDWRASFMMPNRNEDSEVKGLVITFPSFCLLDPKTSLHDKYCLYLRFTSPLRYYSNVH